MSSSGGAIVNPYGKFSFDSLLHRSAAMDRIFESVLSNTFSSNVLKAADITQSFSLEEKQAANLFLRQSGAYVSSLKLDADKGGNVDLSVEGISLSQATPATSGITGATYASPAGRFLTGRELTGLTIGAATARYTKISLTIAADREPQNVLGPDAAIGVATSARKIEIEITGYREGFPFETIALAGAPVNVAFSIGIGADGYAIVLPAMKLQMPESEKDEKNSWFKLKGTADFDPTLGTDFQITKLA